MALNTTVIYLIGLSGTGKYTIAKELAKSGYRIADNQLMNNPIFELLSYDDFRSIPDKAPGIQSAKFALQCLILSLRIRIITMSLPMNC